MEEAILSELEKIRKNTLSQVSVAFGAMAILPLLLTIFLITVRIMSLDGLKGLNGAYFLMMLLLAFLGLVFVKTIVNRAIDKIKPLTAV